MPDGPTSSIGPPGENPSEPHWNLICLLGCGMVAGGPRSFLITQVVPGHFLRTHPELNIWQQGEHFELQESPYRCDLCNIPSEPPFLVRILERPLVVPELNIYDGDGKWLICQPCEKLIRAHDWEAAWDRYLTSWRFYSPGLSLPETAEAMLRTIFYALAGDGGRWEVQDS